MDADNGIVSLALTVYEIENIETWTWLLEILHLDFEKGSNHIPFLLMGKKVFRSNSDHITYYYHSSYARHISANFC